MSISWQFNKTPSLPITEIILGPCIDKAIIEPEIRSLLSEKGYDNILIQQSELSNSYFQTV